VLFLGLKALLFKMIEILKSAIHRNILIIKVTTLAFFIILSLSIIASVLVFSLAPELSEQLSSLAQIAIDYDDIPSPFTGTLVSFIFLNNIGHFLNPIRMLVWIPVLGPFLLGFEILLNSGVIGMIAVTVGISNGVAYPILGLVPHGIIEIPGFLLQFASIVLWQVTISEAIIDKLVGRKLERDKIKQCLKDAFVLAVASIILLMVAAVIETYVTPYLLGL
jgi:stage II sporulation protein M